MISLSAATFSLIISFCPVEVPSSEVGNPAFCKKVPWEVGLSSVECSTMMIREIASFQGKGLREMRGARCEPERGGIEQGE